MHAHAQYIEYFAYIPPWSTAARALNMLNKIHRSAGGRLGGSRRVIWNNLMRLRVCAHVVQNPENVARPANDRAVPT